MSKQSNSTPDKSSQPAASGGGGSAPIKTIKSISGPSIKGTPVGPKNAPYLQK